MPAVRCDLSLVLGEEDTPEELGDGVRAAPGDRAELVEAIEVVSETPYRSLPPRAKAAQDRTRAEERAAARGAAGAGPHADP